MLAILIGTALRTAWTPQDRYEPGIAFAGRTVLDVAVVLLGASLSAPAVLAAGAWLIAGIGVVVMVALAVGFCIGRASGLPPRMAPGSVFERRAERIRRRPWSWSRSTWTHNRKAFTLK